MKHEIRFLDVGGTPLACGGSGTRRPLLIPSIWVADVQRLLEWPSFRAFIDALGYDRTVIRYDRPGSGLSGSGRLPATLDAEEGLLEAVVERFEAPVALFGTSCGACSA